MSPGVAWVVAGLALCAAELLHPGAFLLWIGVAAAAAGGATLALDLDFAAQALAFALLLAGALAVPLWRRRRRPAMPAAGVNAPAADIVGRTCRALAFAGPEGRVAFRDGAWPARTADGSAPAPGAALRIVGLDGTTLVVAPE